MNGETCIRAILSSWKKKKKIKRADPPANTFDSNLQLLFIIYFRSRFNFIDKITSTQTE